MIDQLKCIVRLKKEHRVYKDRFIAASNEIMELKQELVRAKKERDTRESVAAAWEKMSKLDKKHEKEVTNLKKERRRLRSAYLDLEETRDFWKDSYWIERGKNERRNGDNGKG